VRLHGTRAVGVVAVAVGRYWGQALCNAQTARVDNIPYYGRCLAVLATAYNDLPALVVSALEEEHAQLEARRDPTTTDVRVRHARLAGVLTVFGLCPAATTMTYLRAWLEEFSPATVEAACHLLQTCGRFVLRTPATAVRMANLVRPTTKPWRMRVNLHICVLV
jgi:regulator of nonsense transcripts 2